MIQLWDFQDVVIADARDAIRAGHRSLLIVASTGAGKTVIGADIIRSADEMQKQAMFMAHRRELIRQTANKLLDFGVEHGIIMADDTKDRWRGVQVASIDTLRARYMNDKKRNQPDLPKVAILMVDEAHRSMSPTYQKLIKHYKKQGTIIIGLTATPIRGDGKGLGSLYDTMIEAPPMSDLIEMGFLVPPRYYAPTVPDLTGVHIRKGDYVEGELQKVMDRREPVGDIVENWLRICPERKTIVFAAGVKHSIHIAERFRKAGVAAEHVDGTTPTEDRDAILDRLRSGETQLVSNCMVLTEGFDCPSLDAAILARPTKNLGLYIQMGGRILRVDPDNPAKVDGLIIDHSGNLYEHGFLEDDHGWQLTEDDACTSAAERQKKLDEKKPITCSECAHVYTGQLVCPKCGHTPVMRGKDPEHRAADLMEIRRTKREKAAKQAAAKLPPTKEVKQEWFSMFQHYAEEKGHKEGSVAHKYKEKFGVWPQDMTRANPLEPTPECLAFITHLNIKNSYRRKAVAERDYQKVKDNYVPSTER